MLILKHRDDVFSKGEVCNLVPGNQIASLREKQRKVIDSVIKAKIMGLSTPGGQSGGLEHYISI